MNKRIENSPKKHNGKNPIRDIFASFLLAASLNCAAGGKIEDAGYAEDIPQRERVNCSEPTKTALKTIEMGESLFFCNYYFTPLEIFDPEPECNRNWLHFRLNGAINSNNEQYSEGSVCPCPNWDKSSWLFTPEGYFTSTSRTPITQTSSSATVKKTACRLPFTSEYRYRIPSSGLTSQR